jgi:PE-PPE domain
MKAMARSLVMILVALIAVPALAVTQTVTTGVQLLLASSTALILGGTQHPLSPDVDSDQFVNNYFKQATGNYIVPGSNPPGPIATYAVIYPAQFAPVNGTTTFDSSVATGVSNLGACLGATGDTCFVNTSPGVNSPNSPPPPAGTTHFVVFGYSQSAVVASLVKNQLIDGTIPNSGLDGTEFYLVSNPMRPNGGILARGFEGMTIPLIGITFYGPTENSCPGADPCSPGDPGVGQVYPTVDVAQQYDFLGGDAPANPLNLLAMANSLAAYAQLHGNMPNQTIADVPVDGVSPTGVLDQGSYGDTHYYMVTSPALPILLPLESIGVPGAALALPDAVLRVWIESAYVRNQSPGAPVGFTIIPSNPIGLIGNTLGAVPVGIDDTVAQATGNPTNRPLGTADVYRPFGVGGPVYDPTTGKPATDNVGVGTGGGVLPLTTPTQSQQPLTTNTTPKTDQPNTDVASTETPTTSTTPEVTKPQRPLQVVRDSLDFGTHKSPLGLHPSGDGPLKKIANALTGQRPTDAGETASDAPAAKDPAA